MAYKKWTPLKKMDIKFLILNLLLVMFFIGCIKNEKSETNHLHVNRHKVEFFDFFQESENKYLIEKLMCECYNDLGYFSKNQFLNYIEDSELKYDLLQKYNDIGLSDANFDLISKFDTLYLTEVLDGTKTFSSIIKNSKKISKHKCSLNRSISYRIYKDGQPILDSEVETSMQVQDAFLTATIDFVHNITDEKIKLNNLKLWPRKGEPVRTSIIELKKMDTNWLAIIHIKEHSDESLTYFLDEIFTFIDSSSIIEKYQVTDFLFPLNFSERYQLIEYN